MFADPLKSWLFKKEVVGKNFKKLKNFEIKIVYCDFKFYSEPYSFSDSKLDCASSSDSKLDCKQSESVGSQSGSEFDYNSSDSQLDCDSSELEKSEFDINYEYSCSIILV